MLTNFDGNEAKKIQNGQLKKTEFFHHPQKLSNYRQNFMDWSLG